MGIPTLMLFKIGEVAEAHRLHAPTALEPRYAQHLD
jgi:hypothetical protein